MHWLRGIIAILAVAAAGCDRLSGRGPDGPASATAEPASGPVSGLESYSGRAYAEFVAAHEERFGADALGFAANDRARLERATAVSSGEMLEGGGSEALVFRGCAASGCADGVAVVAIDAATGASFVGVRDGAGKDVLAPNERLEALLRLNAPTRDWADAGPQQPSSAAAPAEPVRP